MMRLAFAFLVAAVPFGRAVPALPPDSSSEQKIIAAHSAFIARDGSRLKIAGQVFADQGKCEEGDCTRYRVDGVWHGRYVGIHVSRYEDGDYILIDAKGNGHYRAIGSRPMQSPSGLLFFTGHHDDRDWSPYQGASIWQWEPVPRRLRVVDTDLVMFDSFVAWRDDRCVEFTGARGYNVGLQPVRTYWLSEQEGDWRLFETKPNQCGSASR
jgi:hypothetical protein